MSTRNVKTERTNDRESTPSDQIRELADTKAALLNVLEDLEEEKQRLLEAKIMDDAILEQILDGVIVLDSRSRVLIFNDAAKRILHINDTSLAPKDWKQFFKIFDVSGSREILLVDFPLMRALRGDDVRNEEFVIRLIDSERSVSIRMSASPLRIEGTPQGAVAVFHDTTKEKEIDRARNEFISFASHQLRTPITGIRWSIDQMRKRNTLPKEIEEYINDIDSASARVVELAEQLLSKTRLELGSTQVQLTHFDAREEVRSVIGDYVSTAIARGVTVNFTQEKPVPMYSDRFMIRNITSSIISNAIDYTSAGGSVTISLTKDEDGIHFTVTDTGIGIPPQEQQQVFTSFFRASNSALTKVNGSGLGLYIAAESVKLLGGTIHLESQLNKGTTFRIVLPLQIPPTAQMRPSKS